jgi:hypothetical protein
MSYSSSGNIGDEREDVIHHVPDDPFLEDGEAFSEEDIDKIFNEANKRYIDVTQSDHHNREEMLDDLRFVNGDQWDTEATRIRQLSGRPTITVPYISTLVDSIVGDYRQNKPGLKVSPVGGDGDEKTANILQGLFRHINEQGGGDAARMWGLECSVKCGQGFYRLHTKYCRPDSFHQDVYYKKILNPLSVFPDPHADTPLEMRFCFLTDDIPRSEFTELYPDAGTISVTTATGDFDPGWESSEDTVKIAEYWWVEYRKKTIALMDNGAVMDLKDVPKEEHFRVEKTRETHEPKVFMAKITGKEIVEGPHEWPGSFIPVLWVYGKTEIIDNTHYRRGIVRFSKDSQRVLNYVRSSTVEWLQQAPKVPYIGTPEMFEGHEDEWDTSNTQPRQRLTYNKQPGGDRPYREAPPQVPSGLVQEAEQARRDMHTTSGVFEASTGQRSNEVSGKALKMRQQEISNNSFAFLGNLHQTMIVEGRMLLDIIPKIYDTHRIVRIIDEYDRPTTGQVNVPDDSQTPGDSVDQVLNDLSIGDYDVTISTGPAYETLRQESVEQMLEFLRHNPGLSNMFMDLIAGGSDWPGADKIQKRLETLLPPNIQALEGLTDPEAQPPPPDPAQQMEMQKAQMEIQLQELEVQKKQMEVQKASAQVEKAQVMDEQQVQRIAAQTVLELLNKAKQRSKDE